MARAPAVPGLKPGARPVKHTAPVALYDFKDLAGPAREKALSWLRECVVSDSFSLDGWKETVGADLKALGFTLGTMRHGKEPALYYSLSYCQGDGVAFEGPADLAEIVKCASAAAVEKHAPKGDLPALPAATLEKAERLLALDNHGTTATLNVRNVGRYFSTETTLDVDRVRLDDEAQETAARALTRDLVEDLREWVGSLCSAFETSGYAEREYQEGDEALSESMEANGYTFTADGKREG